MIYVNDLRDNNDASLSVIPRLKAWEGVQSYFGVSRLEMFGWEVTPNGQKCWRLVGVHIRTGAAAYIPCVLDERGYTYWHKPTETGALVVRTWPGCPEIKTSDPIRPDYNTVLDGYAEHHAVAGFTNENGDIGFPYEHGSIGGPDGGPDVIWVHAVPTGYEPQYSDCITGLGWIGGTDHLTVNPVFKLMTKEDGTTPLPPEALVNIDAEGNITGHIPFVPGPPREERKALGLWIDGEVVGHVNWAYPAIQPMIGSEWQPASDFETKRDSFVAKLVKRIGVSK